MLAGVRLLAQKLSSPLVPPIYALMICLIPAIGSSMGGGDIDARRSTSFGS
jgi:hypothetical protein